MSPRSKSTRPLRRPPGCRLRESDLRKFAAGRHFALHEKLGAHPTTVDGKAGVSFGVWAPGAATLSVVGDFNGWDSAAHPMEPFGTSGIWCSFVEGLSAGALYKYHLVSRHNDYRVDKTDPFAFDRQAPPETASVVCDLTFEWSDGAWLETRAATRAAVRPMSIYELHLGSWRRDDEDPARLPSYDEIGDRLIPHLEETGFTHVELLPLTEHPFYGSWGYQTTGYFAPTRRYGSPQELMRLIDRLHAHGIGVVMDWVPSHFPGDEHGLAFFDGSRLFEYADPRLGYHPDWKSYIFDYGRGEVRSFLISSALFWLQRYHIDALRVDAVASMLYRDYSRGEGEWLPNEHGGKENLEAIQLLRELNDAVHEHDPSICTIAEESTSWPMVSRPAYVGGLGFDMKWDMGWMHDTLEYMQLDPIFRKYHHEALTFRMMYAYSENFVLPLSHDEVVHGKGSLIGRMPGDYWQKFANLRALYGYTYGLPGKKLLFMGAELAQWREWDHESGLDWKLLDYPAHAGIHRWICDLNRIYRNEPALHSSDFSSEGFRWIDCSDADQSVVSFIRLPVKEQSGTDGSGDVVLVICNMTPVPRENYRVGVPVGGSWSELLNSDAEAYGGSGIGNLGSVDAVAMSYHGCDHSICLRLPPLSTIFLKHTGAQPPVPGAVLRRAP